MLDPRADFRLLSEEVTGRIVVEPLPWIIRAMCDWRSLVVIGLLVGLAVFV